jgi:methyltransferase (TIGR00027 family)
MVAFFRGAASVRRSPFGGMRDAFARALVPRWLSVPLRAVERAPVLLPAARMLSVGLLDHVSLRTAAIDEALRMALAAGARQLVILGAGLDARAYRLPELAGVSVFEVDHPATQAAKRERLAEAGDGGARVVFVGVDFERDALAERLASAGHDAAIATAWIWEGVTPYLDRVAIEATLGVLASRSAPSSTLLVTYLTPELAAVPVLPKPLVRAVFSALGEPIKATFEPYEIEALLAAHGFLVYADTSSDDWAVRYLEGARSRVRVGERLAAATRRPS